MNISKIQGITLILNQTKYQAHSFFHIIFIFPKIIPSKTL